MEEVAILIPLIGVSIPIVAIVAHYVSKDRERRHQEMMSRSMMSDEDAESFARMADRLERRMKTLESILDDEVPGWRRKYDD